MRILSRRPVLRLQHTTRLKGLGTLAVLAAGYKMGSHLLAQERKRHAAPARPLNVVCFGDSLTAGYRLSSINAYPSILEDKARERGLSVNFINAGVSGDTSARGLSRLPDTLEQQHIDVFLLALGANDVIRLVPPAAMKSNLDAILRQVRLFAPTAPLIILGMRIPPLYGEHHAREFQRVFSDLAEQYDAALVPHLLDGVFGVPHLNLEDGLHPNELGHELMAGIIWKTLEPILVRAMRLRRKNTIVPFLPIMPGKKRHQA